MAWTLQKLTSSNEVKNCGGLYRIGYKGSQAIRGTTKINGVIGPARVTLFSNTGQRIGFRVTGSDGAYVFEALAPGDYTLLIGRNNATDVRSKVEHVRIESPVVGGGTIYGFDPAYKNAGLTLSEGNTVATRTLASPDTTPGNDQFMTVRSTEPVFRYQYFEFHVGAISPAISQLMMLGVASEVTLTNESVSKRVGSAGASPDTYGLHFNDSNYYNDRGPGYISGTIIGCAIGKNGGIFFSYNGKWGYNNPISQIDSVVSVTGVAYPAATLYEQDTSVKIVLNARDFVYAMPPGYSARAD